ncbi:MAG: hypothetical protein IKG93_08340 [Clostridiales bacterium]|nr:hypothetical protein [Clostridiales bacterium]
MKYRHLSKKAAVLFLTIILALTACNRYTTKTTPVSQEAYTVPTGVSVPEKTQLVTESIEEEDPTSDLTDAQVDASKDISISKTVDADDDLAKELLTLPGVVKVGTDPKFEENQYLIYYEMPIDHNDPGKGTFVQRLYLYYRGKDAPNVFNIGGYNIYCGVLGEKENMLSERYNCNFFEPEYRFDGLSRPEGFTSSNTENWEYLTCAQASEDYHFMIESLKSQFSGKWCIEGMSKGGEFTAYQAGKHPEDAELFIAESAMLKNCDGFPGLYEYCYTTAGDDTFGKEKAKEYRDMLLQFQVELIKNRDVLQDEYWKKANELYHEEFSSTFTKELLFDCSVLDLNYIWQFAMTEEFDSVREALEVKDDPNLFPQYAINAMTEIYGPWQYAVTYRKDLWEQGTIYNYLFQCFHEDGYYAYDFSYLRKALEKDGSGASLYVTEDMEKDLFKLRIQADHQKQFSFSRDAVDTRLKAVETTEKPLILVNPTTDVHYIAEVTESNNPNVHIFPVIGGGHGDSEWNSLTEEQLAEYDKIVKAALGI